MRRLLAETLVGAAMILCPAAAPSQQSIPQSRIRYWESDSIALDRLRGGWDFKAYRILIAKDGRVTVTPDSLARSLFPVIQVQPAQFQNIMSLVLIGSFGRVPDEIAADPVFGQVCGSDAPTMIVTVYHPQATKRVVDDQGCFFAPAFLRDLERMILEAAGLRKPDQS
jgi:hypothetical protein